MSMKMDRDHAMTADRRDVVPETQRPQRWPAPGSAVGNEWTRTWHAEPMRWLRLAGARLARWSRTGEGRSLLILLGVALLIRLPLLPYHGFFHDPQTYLDWGINLDRDPLHFYTNTLSANYTPLTPYLDGLMWLIYQAAAHLLGQPAIADTYHSALLATIFKIPDLVAELALTAVTYHVVRPVVTHRWALAAAAIYALSPAILFVGVLYGQTDATYTVFVVLAVVATYRRQSIRAGAYFALAFMLKPTPIFLLPLLAVALWRYAGWRGVARFGGAFAVVSGTLWMPFLLPPHFEVLRWVANVQFDNKSQASYNAANFWWAVGARGRSSLTPIYAGLTPSQIGWAVFAAVLLAAALAAWKSASFGVLLFTSAIVALTFFEITPDQHERFVYLAPVLFLLAAAYHHRRASLALCLCFSGIMLLNTVFNLALQYPISIDDLDLSYWHGFLMYTHPKYLRLFAAGSTALWLGSLAILAGDLAIAYSPRATMTLLAWLRAKFDAMARPSAAPVKSRR